MGFGDRRPHEAEHANALALWSMAMRNQGSALALEMVSVLRADRGRRGRSALSERRRYDPRIAIALRCIWRPRLDVNALHGQWYCEWIGLTEAKRLPRMVHQCLSGVCKHFSVCLEALEVC
jgi:hypothetical protein